MSEPTSLTLDILARLDTPCVLIEMAKLHANIERVRRIAARHGVALRPHIKTHKSLEIGRLQLEAGAVGITASKPDEAACFMRNGFQSITLAYPLIDPIKIERLLGVARDHSTDLCLIADSQQGVEAIQRAASTVGGSFGIFIKIDVGLHRCGLAPDDPRLPELARAVHGHNKIELRGLLSHAGHVYGAADQRQATAIAREECLLMQAARQRLEAVDIPVREVSVGSTPTVLASESYEGITEIRPGNYVFMDRAPITLGLAEPVQVALTVVATVVSRSDRYTIIDAGSKVLSSDGGAHGSTGPPGFGVAYPAARFGDPAAALTVVKLSEEHGWVEPGPVPVEICDRLRIIPNHACVVANLTDSYRVLTATGDLLTWSVQARGLVH